MITLRHLTKGYKRGTGTLMDSIAEQLHGIRNEVRIFDDVSLTVPSDRRIAVLGPPESGKSTLIRLLAGLESPTSGTIECHARVSFPVGYPRGLKPDLSPRQNAIFAARVHDADVEEVTRFVETALSIGDAFDEPTSRLLQKTRASFCYALAYAIPFDVYLIDGQIGSGPAEFKKKCEAMFQVRANECGVVMVAPNSQIAKKYCDMGIVVKGGKLFLFEDVGEAIKFNS